MIGQTISHYKILAKLGEGGMGIVYKAVDLKLDRAVALKFLPSELTRDHDAKARFIHEAKAASALDHPNVCTVYEIDEADDGLLFMAMACYEGETLKERIAQGPLPIEDTLEITRQVAEGLAKAHEQKIVHRDIKPANILMTTDGLVKVMDFGVAKLRGRTLMTRTGTTLGTAAYMSPEQAQGEETDSRADIWSLGVVLYEMISGRRPFEGDHEQAVIYSILNQEPEPVTALRSNVPMELERVVAKCLAKYPEERYQTIADLLADLRRMQRISGAETVMTSSVSTPQHVDSVRRRWSGFLGLAILALVAGFVLSRVLLPTGGETEDRKMLAVLPLENLGSAEDEYFADGLTEEITSRLAGLNGLGVISRTSTMRYKSDRPTLKQIGQELGVEYVLEGTVRWEHREGGASRVLVTPQLIRVADDTHLWTDRYLRDLAEIFAVQADIAREVARELNVTLLEREQVALEIRPTENLAAYEAYLRGLDALKNPNSREEDFLMAVAKFEQAIALDPDFTMAYVRLSEAHGEMFFWGFDGSTARSDQADVALQAALSLEPDLPEVHRALGSYHYMVHKDYERALAEFSIAERGLPNDPEILETTAYIRRRQGRFEEAIDQLRRAASLDPRNAWLRMQLGYSHTCIRSYAEAERYFTASIALEPDQIIVYVFQALNHALHDANLERARKALSAAPDQDARLIVSGWYNLAMWNRNYPEAIVHLNDMADGIPGATAWLINKDLLAGHAYRAMDEPDQAEASFAVALSVLEPLVKEQPHRAGFHSALGQAYAGVGRHEDAIREGGLGVELASNDALLIADRYRELAIIFIMCGELDKAIDALESALSVPGMISVALLEIAPMADPLRDHPRFQQLMKIYAGQ